MFVHTNDLDRLEVDSEPSVDSQKTSRSHPVFDLADFAVIASTLISSFYKIKLADKMSEFKRILECNLQSMKIYLEEDMSLGLPHPLLLTTRWIASSSIQ